ncbi:MAG: threonylcarbamoyl-AMP synthase [Terrimonas sp.]|nr:threonylcarbamoyl-AMP synthase [Terrimonas sp.]
MDDFQNDLVQSLDTLRKGGVILYPTDTVWGIGCDATDEAAVEKIYTIKNRPGEKAMIVLLTDKKDILQYVANPDPAVFEFLQQQQKPTTVIYENALGFAANLIGKDGTIAIRLCHDPFCRQLIKRLKKPLVSTSANLSGSPSPALYSEITAEIRNAVDYTVQYRQDDRNPAKASAVVKWIPGAEPLIIRP